MKEKTKHILYLIIQHGVKDKIRTARFVLFVRSEWKEKNTGKECRLENGNQFGTTANWSGGVLIVIQNTTCDDSIYLFCTLHMVYIYSICTPDDYILT